MSALKTVDDFSGLEDERNVQITNEQIEELVSAADSLAQPPEEPLKIGEMGEHQLFAGLFTGLQENLEFAQKCLASGETLPNDSVLCLKEALQMIREFTLESSVQETVDSINSILPEAIEEWAEDKAA